MNLQYFRTLGEHVSVFDFAHIFLQMNLIRIMAAAISQKDATSLDKKNASLPTCRSFFQGNVELSKPKGTRNSESRDRVPCATKSVDENATATNSTQRKPTTGSLGHIRGISR